MIAIALKWVRANIVPALVIGLLLIGAAMLAWNQWQSLRGAKVETKIETGQKGAAIASGSDAVQTIGNNQDRVTEIKQTVKDGTDEIDKATAGDSNDAADRAACRMRAYRNTSECIALLGAAP